VAESKVNVRTTYVPVKRQANACVENKYGELVVEVELRHRVDNSSHDEDRRVWNNVDGGDTTPADLLIRYVTSEGHIPPRDYWYAEVTLQGEERHRTSEDFICDLHALTRTRSSGRSSQGII
jgi:hypothetical protein